MYSKLQYISQGLTAKEQLENIQSTLDAGCEWVQLRFKNADEKEFSSIAEQVKNVCEKYNATFIINDNVELARKINADGVHLGLQDMPVLQARAILGDNKIIGGTANTLADVLIRIDESCDYIGLGPFRFTLTKTNLSPVLGLDVYKNIMNEVLKNKNQIPIYAIGGISIDDVASILNTGVYGIAVSGAITKHSNKKELVQTFNSLLYSGVIPIPPFAEEGSC
ncbi:MAG: thiamine phosphate synthase [Bacteroidetes bacterium]|nr:thiamine phosphate synthase [Bacteroidota bacterium]